MTLKSNWLEQQGKARKLLQAKRFNEKFWKKKKSLNTTKLTMRTQAAYKHPIAFMQLSVIL